MLLHDEKWDMHRHFTVKKGRKTLSYSSTKARPIKPDEDCGCHVYIQRRSTKHKEVWHLIYCDEHSIIPNIAETAT